MPTLMCTQALWQAIGGQGRLPPRQPGRRADDVRLADWSLRELTTPLGHVVVGLEETTYLTVVFHLNMLPAFLRDLAQSAAIAVQDIGIDEQSGAREAQAILDHSRFGKNDNRSLLGSVNDVAFHVSVEIEEKFRTGGASLRRAQARMNRMPHVHRDPSWPEKAVRRLFGAG